MSSELVNKIKQRIKKIVFHVKKQQPNIEKRDSLEELKLEMQTYFLSNPEKQKEFSGELDFINGMSKSLSPEYRLFYSLYPYPFIVNYKYEDVEVLRDNAAEMYYVILDDKRLYYHRGFTKEDVQKSFICLKAEQDFRSPHCYLDDFFFVNESDIVGDFGSAEGNFSLLIVDKVKKIVIVEPDVKWIAALEKTFEPWKNKVRIINKLVGNSSDINTVTLDGLMEEENLTAIKMDIEGAEAGVLENAGQALKNRRLKLAVCSYHAHDDASKIKSLLDKNGFDTRYSNNHMLFVYDSLKPPYFRKGLVKAFKTANGV